MAKPDFQLKWGVNRSGGIPTTDPADYQLGWQYRSGLPPLTGSFDYYQNLADERLLYLNAQGIPEWDALTAYDTDAYVKGSDGEIYRSTAPTTGNDPTLGGPWVAGLSVPDASETVKGIVELATDAETVSGVDNTKATHPSGVSAAISALAIGGSEQSWVDVTASRTTGVTYTNTTGKPIVVNVLATSPSGVTAVLLDVNGVASFGNTDYFSSTASRRANACAIVPDGNTYTLISASGTVQWQELR